MRTGPRSQTLQSADEYKTGSRNAIIVSISILAQRKPQSFSNCSQGKKIKRRLEDLEKRATSSSPEQTQRELAIPPRVNDTNKRRKSKSDTYPQVRQRTPESLNHTPYLTPSLKSDFSPDYGRELSLSPPPTFNPSYSLAPGANLTASYYEQPPSNILPAPYADYPTPQYSLPPLPQSLPSMSPYDSSKATSLYENDETFPQYAMGAYAPFTSVELPMTQSYSDSNAHVIHPEYSFHFQ